MEILKSVNRYVTGIHTWTAVSNAKSELPAVYSIVILFSLIFENKIEFWELVQCPVCDHLNP